ncbi:MAG: magnesium/cobalt transporter CorA [Puniceicoccales bacterium]|jgi:magnesium transporter|nr:magnesium/cobalt transporter CorA [Puniceicoccales bacterium]
MSRRSERRRRAFQRSQKYARARLHDAQRRLGLDEDQAPLHSENIAEANEHDQSEIGRAPGQLPASSPFESAGPTRFRVFCYDESSYSIEEFSEVDKLTNYVERSGVTWVQMLGLTDPEIVHIVGAIFNVPMLAQEDILAIWSRSKFDEYGDMVLGIARAVRLSVEDTDSRGQQISFIAAANFVISFHENDDPVFDAIERRIKENSGRIRRWGPGFLFYAIFDTLVDRLLYLTEEIEDAISDLEDKNLTDESGCNIDEVYRLKRILVRLGRVAIPLRDTVRVLEHYDHPLLPRALDMYFSDLNDHALRVGDRVEHARMILQELQEYHHTIQEHKTNDIIRVLTVMSSIFIPLTFLAGIYGMNFDYMPETHSVYSYPICIFLMALFAAGMLLYFRRRKWI